MQIDEFANRIPLPLEAYISEGGGGVYFAISRNLTSIILILQILDTIAQEQEGFNECIIFASRKYMIYFLINCIWTD